MGFGVGHASTFLGFTIGCHEIRNINFDSLPLLITRQKEKKSRGHIKRYKDTCAESWHRKSLVGCGIRSYRCFFQCVCTVPM